MDENQIDEGFIVALQQEDELGVSIRVHLHIEYWVNELVREMVPFPEQLKPMELEYCDKIHLLCAIGLKDRHKGPLLQMGRIRNRFAHKIDFSIDKNTVNNLYKSFDEEDKKIAQKIFEQCASEENREYKTFRKMMPKDQFVFMAVAILNMVKAAVYQVRRDA